MAIAFDAATNGGGTTSTSLTYSHTTSGSNRVLLVACVGSLTADRITGVTYAGVAMTLVDKRQATGDRWLYLFILANPASGANNVVVSSSPNDYIGSGAVSYTGAKQVGQPDASAKGESGSPRTQSVTTAADSCWTVMFAYSVTTGTVTAGSGSTSRVRNSAWGEMLDSNGPITPAGSTSMTISGSGNLDTIIASIAPASAPPWAPLGIFSVKDFGAKGDGVTDDTTAIQSCIASAGSAIVFFPPGVYIISSQLAVSSNGAIICGVGINNSILKRKAGTSSFDFLYLTGDDSSVCHLTIDGNYPNTTNSSGTELAFASTRGNVDRIKIINSSFISIEVLAPNITIRNSTLIGLGTADTTDIFGIWAGNSDGVDLVVKNCVIEDYYLNGVLTGPYPIPDGSGGWTTVAAGSERTKILSCYLKGNNRMEGAGQICAGCFTWIEDCTFEETQNSFAIEAHGGGIFSRNKMIGNGSNRSSFELQGRTHYQVSENIANGYAYGYHYDEYSGVLDYLNVHDNDFSGCTNWYDTGSSATGTHIHVQTAW